MIFGKMKVPKHEEHWNSYFTTIEGHHASIFLDMGLKDIAPVAKMETLLAIDMQFTDFDDNGLPTDRQAQDLFLIEDQLAQKLSEDIKALFIGRMTYHMQRKFYFYLFDRDGLTEKAQTSIAEIFSAFPDYAYEVDCGVDEGWTHYLERLYPSEEERHIMNNMSLLTALQDKGDDFLKPRMVQHWCYFRGENLRALFSGEVVAMGFELIGDHFHDDGSELPYALSFQRQDLINFQEINQLTLPLYDLAKKYNGYYDCWEVRLPAAS